MWKVDDALEGRLAVGESRGGRGEEEYIIRLSGKRFYHLQKFLEEAATNSKCFFDTRMAVMLWEEVRKGVLVHGKGDETLPSAKEYTACAGGRREGG